MPVIKQFEQGLNVDTYAAYLASDNSAGFKRNQESSSLIESMPNHLVREYQSTYSQQIGVEKYLVLKVKEVEKENRLLRGKLFSAEQEL